MKKYQFGILLAATRDSAFSIGTLLLNIQAVMQDKVDMFYIVHDGFLESDKEIMTKIVRGGGVKFVDFSLEDFVANICKYNANAKIDNNSVILKRYTHMSYARFEALRFLEECEVIAYLDFDMLLLKSIEELKQSEEFDIGLFRGSATLSFGLGRLCPHNLRDVKNYSSGIIVFYNEKLKGIKDYVYRFIAREFQDYFKEVKLGDQALLNLYLIEKNLRVKELSDDYYGNISWKKSSNASIIHAWGEKNRFWNNKLCALAWQQWWVYYNQWLSLGGSKYEGGWKANLEVPLSGGEVFQYFERIRWAREILAIDLESYELVLLADFGQKVKFNFAGFSRDIMLCVYSNSIYNFVLEIWDCGKLVCNQTIRRNDLQCELPRFIYTHISFIQADKEKICQKNPLKRFTFFRWFNR